MSGPAFDRGRHECGSPRCLHPEPRLRLTSAQRRIVDVLAAGGRLWRSCPHADGAACRACPTMLVGPGPLAARKVRRATVARLLDLGAIVEAFGVYGLPGGGK